MATADTSFMAVSALNSNKISTTINVWLVGRMGGSVEQTKAHQFNCWPGICQILNEEQQRCLPFGAKSLFVTASTLNAK